MEQSIQISGKTYEVENFVGQAVGLQSSSETHIGGNEYSVSSTITTYNELFLIDENGKERHFELVDWGIPLRAGHTIQIIGLYVNKKDGFYVAGYNTNLDRLEWCEDGLQKIARKKYFVPTMIIGVILLVTTFIGAIFAYVIYKMLCKSFIKSIKKEVKSLLI